MTAMRCCCAPWWTAPPCWPPWPSRSPRWAAAAGATALRSSLTGARTGIGGDPDLVLFTGGASRMGFVVEDAHEIFPTARVVRGKAPELAIAKGLAWWGRARLRAAAFTAEVDALCAQPGDGPSAIGAVVREELPALLAALARALADGLAEQVIIPFGRAWREGRLATLRDFEQTTEAKAALWIDSEAGRAAVSEAARVWLVGLARVAGAADRSDLRPLPAVPPRPGDRGGHPCVGRPGGRAHHR